MPNVWIVTTPDALDPQTRRIRAPLEPNVALRSMLRDAYAQAFRTVDHAQLAALEAHALSEGHASAELDCMLRNGTPFRVILSLENPDHAAPAPPGDLHRPKMWRLSFDNTRPPRVAYIRSQQGMGDELRRGAFFILGFQPAQIHGPRFADVMRRATSDHTTHVTYTCEAGDGARHALPVTLTDEEATPLDVASLL